MAKIITKEQWEQRVRSAGAGRYEFVRWVADGEFGAKKYCIVRCLKDGFEWRAKPNNLVDGGKGCPQCSGNRRWTAEERIEQINKLENIEFASWVDGYKNVYSKANVKCKVDAFEWSPTINDIINGGYGCPQCAGRRRWTAEERILQVNETNNIRFISWVCGYKNSYSKANVRCEIDGFEWSAVVHSIVNNGSGCPQCAGLRRWTPEERIEQINKLENIEFVSWVDGYNGRGSKANVICNVDGIEWSATVHDLVNGGYGCPKCAKYGYDKSKAGFLYSLRSECGRYLKVGISNNPERRQAELIRSTPFTFSCIEQLEGDGVKISELEKHFHDKYERAGFTGFDGCTEWLVCSNELLSELRGLSIEHE